MALHAETVTILHVTTGEPDESGVATETTTERVLTRCNVQPVGTNESIGEVAPVTGRWRVSTFEIQDGIEVSDRIRWRDEVFDVLGYPQTFYAIRPHTEFVIVRIGG